MFTKGIIIGETEYHMLLSDFIEMLKERIEELDKEERDELLKSRKKFEEWVRDCIAEMFDFVLEDNNVEAAMIYTKGKWYYIFNGDQFCFLSYGEEGISDVIEELEKELKGRVEKSSSRRRVRK
jgi:hypothetical protein